MLRVLLLLLAVACPVGTILACLPSASASPTGWENLTWGMRPVQVRDAFPGAALSLDPEGPRHCSIGDGVIMEATYARDGITYKVTFCFRVAQLAMVTLHATGISKDDADHVLTSLRSEYGRSIDTDNLRGILISYL